MQQLVMVHENVLKKLKVDTRIIIPNESSIWSLKIEKMVDGSRYYTDQYGINWRMPKGGLYFDPIGHPLVEGSREELNNYPFPNPSDLKRIEGLKLLAKKYYENGFSVTMSNIGGGWFELPFWLRGFENFYCDLAGDPKYAYSLMDKLLEIEMAYWDLIFTELGDYIDVVLTANDLGGQQGPIVSPSMYRKYIKPRQKKLNSFIKKKNPSSFGTAPGHCIHSSYQSLPTPYLTLLVSQI